MAVEQFLQKGTPPGVIVDRPENALHGQGPDGAAVPSGNVLPRVDEQADPRSVPALPGSK